MKLVIGLGASIVLLGALSAPLHAQWSTGGASNAGATAFSQNQFPELKGLTNSKADKAKASSLCAKYGGSNQERVCWMAAAYYMSEGQQKADAQRQQEAAASQAVAPSAQSQQEVGASTATVASQPHASVSSVPAAVEPISDDDMVDYVSKALVVYAMHQGDAWICSANPQVQQCEGRLRAFDDQHFPNVANPVTAGIVRHGSSEGKKTLIDECRLKISHSLETLREWGQVLTDDESKWDAGIASVRSRVNAGGCSSEEIAYFDKITSAALERAEDVVPKMKAQAVDHSQALAQCKASAAYKRFDDAASIPNLRANLATQESYLQGYLQVRPATVKDANKLQNSIANENTAIAEIKQMLAQKSDEYQNLGGSVSDKTRMSKDASSNPCAALGDDWQHDFN